MTDTQVVPTQPLMTDQQLQAKLVEFAAEGTEFYYKISGTEGLPEHYLQNYVAIKVAKLGFVITVETNWRELCEFCQLIIDRDAGCRIDLVIYDPASDGDPSHSKVRAIVEFKRDACRLDADVKRTARFLRSIIDAGWNAFGYVIAAGWFHDRAELLHAEFTAGEKLGYGSPIQRKISATLPGHRPRYASVVGLAIPAAEVAAIRREAV